MGFTSKYKNKGIRSIKADLAKPEDLMTFVEIVSKDSKTSGKVPYKFNDVEVKKNFNEKKPNTIDTMIKKNIEI